MMKQMINAYRIKDTLSAEKAIDIKVEWPKDFRYFSVRGALEKKQGSMMLEHLGGSVEVDGQVVFLADALAAPVVKKTLPGQNISYAMTCTFPESGFTWQWDIMQVGAGINVSTTIMNTGRVPLTIGSWNVLHIDKTHGGSVELGREPENVRFFAWNPWDMRVELLSSQEGRHSSTNLCHLYNPISGLTLLCGFTSLDRMRCHHSLNYSKSDGIREFKMTCDFGKYLLPPGGEIISEELHISFHTDPYRALEAWADKIYDRYKPVLADLPPVGWIGASWIDPFSEKEDCYEKVALSNARAIREKLKGYDVGYIWTSQANLKDGIPGNWLSENKKQIPSGIKRFFAAQQKLGYRPGLWVAPLWFYSEAAGVLEENRENLLRDIDGNPMTTVEGWGYDYGDHLPWYKMHKYYLDGTHPKSTAFMRKIFSYYRKIGVRYYMLDFLSIVENARLHNPSKFPLEAARSTLGAVRKAAGKDTHIQTAVSSTPGYVGLINAARVGRDFGEGRPLQGGPLSDWRNATYCLHDGHYANTKALLQNVAANYFTHRKLYMNDFNLLTIDKPVPLEHARIAVTLFGLGGSPMMLGDDYRMMDPERLRMVKMCLPRTRDMFTPVDLFDHVSPSDYCRILKLPIKTAWDSYLLVAVFNMDDKPYCSDLDFAKLGLEGEKPYRIYEFWTQEYCGTFTHGFHSEIPSNACRLYRISEARRYPWLLSTDMHAQQGAVEIRSLAWDKKSMRLTGTACRPAGETGNLFFLMPRKFRLINHQGTGLMKELRDMTVVIRKPIKFRKACETFELLFEPWELPRIAPRELLSYGTEKEWLEYVKSHRKPDETRVVE
jgi:hypothetical protein